MQILIFAYFVLNKAKLSFLKKTICVVIISIYPNYGTQNYPFCRLQLVVETVGHSTYEPNNLNSTKVPKVVKPSNEKKTLWTS